MGDILDRKQLPWVFVAAVYWIDMQPFTINTPKPVAKRYVYTVSVRLHEEKGHRHHNCIYAYPFHY